MCVCVCVFKASPIATTDDKVFCSDKGEWALSQQQTVSATEVKIKTKHAAGSAHGSLCEVEKVEHSVKEIVSGLRPGFKTPPLLSCLPDICNLGRLLSLWFLI